MDRGFDTGRREPDEAPHAAVSLPEAGAADAYIASLGPQLQKCVIAVEALWPNGVPAVFGIRELYRRIGAWCVRQGLCEEEVPSEPTVRRFFHTVLPRLIALGHFRRHA